MPASTRLIYHAHPSAHIMKRESLLCLGSGGFHRMHYYEWGDRTNPRVVICVHGLTRNGRDFDYLAQQLAGDFRVVCPDVVGRGASDWLAVKTDYGMPQYLADMTALIARITAEGNKSLDWVGTSMGAMVGMAVAAMPNNPIRKLVVNDASKVIPKAALERLASYVGRDPRFATFDELQAHVRSVAAPFGPHSDEQWRHLTVHVTRQFPDGSWGFVYDPAIGDVLRGELNDIDLSAVWDAVKCPTLLLRGEHSDILHRDVAQAMTQRGPRTRLIEIQGVGHAPTLMHASQVDVVRDFLLEKSA